MPLTEVEGEFDVVVANILAAALVELGADLVGRETVVAPDQAPAVENSVPAPEVVTRGG